MSSLHPGINSTGGGQNSPKFLPLESVVARAYIVDISARVDLCQLYTHKGTHPLVEAYYVFPVPARATVCAFEMETDDGRRLKGVVKEITQARVEYSEAIREGKFAGLLEQFKQDVFVVHIGTIPPRTHVTVYLSYFMDLSEDDENDTVRFHLPSHVGIRYGAPPESVISKGTAHRVARVNITVDVEMASSIIKIWSPSHSDNTSTSILRGNSDRCARLEWSSMDEYLRDDFVLVVQAEDLDIPRCFAEKLSSSNNLSCSSSTKSTTALGLTLVPRINLPTLVSQEYIFVIDRSGSMIGQPIELAKTALKYLLRALPSGPSTTFNIFSFGFSYTCLWGSSAPYNDSTLDEATLAVDVMDADMGGTELLNCLTYVFGSKSTTMPSSVFVLTDGGVINTEDVIQCARQAVASAADSAPLRIFSLGIGYGVSTELCQGIADAGKGVFAMALEAEDLMLKAARLVGAMRTSPVGALTIEWGGQNEGEELQAPDKIQSLLPGARIVVTTIVTHDVPSHVVVKCRLSDGNNLEHRVPVQIISPQVLSGRKQNTIEPPPLLHTIAAHHYIRVLEQIIQDYDAGVLLSSNRRFSGLSPPAARDLAKSLVVDLATQYQVASSLTAFLAVDAPRRQRPTKPPSTARHGSKTAKSKSSSESSARNSPHHNGTTSRRTGDNEQEKKESKTKTPQTSGNKPPKDTPSNLGQPNSPGSAGNGLGTSQEPSTGQANSPGPSRPAGAKKSKQASQQSPNSAVGGSQSHRGSTSSRHTDHSATTGKRRPTSSRIDGDVISSPEGSSGAADPPLDFFAQVQPEGAAADEVLVLSDPLGGEQPVICTAPPLAQASIYPRFPGRSFLSMVFRVKQSVGRIVGAGVSGAWNLYQQTVRREDTASTRRLQQFSVLQKAGGSFVLSNEFSSAIGIPETVLRSSMPSSLTSVDNGEQIWATAVAIAFFREKYPRQKVVWEALENKAREFVSRSLADGAYTVEDTVRDARTLFAS